MKKVDNPTRFQVTIAKADLEKLDAIAKRKQLTRADLVREAVRRYLESERKRYKEG